MQFMHGMSTMDSCAHIWTYLGAPGAPNSRCGPTERASMANSSGACLLPATLMRAGACTRPSRRVTSDTVTSTCPLAGTTPSAGSAVKLARQLL